MDKSPAVVTQELRAELWGQVGVATRMQVDELARVLLDMDAPDAAAGDPTARAQGARLAHTIAGTLGVYGFRVEARAASRLDALLRATGDDLDLAEALSLVGVLQSNLAGGA